MKKAIILLLLLAGCQFLQTTGPSYETPVIYTGTEGIEIAVLEHLPEVYEGLPVEITFSVQNRGAYDVPKSDLKWAVSAEKLTAEDESTIPAEVPDPLKGKKIENPRGDEYWQNYLFEAEQIEGPRRTAPILARACYTYKTTATTEVCIDTDPKNTGPKPCTTGTTSLAGGQGAPLAITEVTTEMIPNPTQNGMQYIPKFEIKIENLGTGQVLNKDVIEEFCAGNLEEINDDADIFNVLDVTLNFREEELSCSREAGRNMKLQPEQTVFKCVAGPVSASEGTFTSLLEAELDYGYTTTATTSVDILSQDQGWITE